MIKYLELVSKISYLASLNDINEIKKELSLINFKDIENSDLGESFLQMRSVVINAIKNGENVNTIKNNLTFFIKDAQKIVANEIARKEKEKGKEEVNEASKLLEQRTILETHDELVGLAGKCGYIVDGERTDGTLILLKDGKTRLTSIPRHNITRGTARGIMKVLATGRSNFRRFQSVSQ